MDGRKRDKNAQRHGQSKHSQNSYEMGFQTKRPLNNDPFDPTSAIASAIPPLCGTQLAGFHQTFTSLTTSNSAQGIAHHNPFLTPAGVKTPMTTSQSLLPTDASYFNQIATRIDLSIILYKSLRRIFLLMSALGSIRLAAHQPISNPESRYATGLLFQTFFRNIV